MRRYIDSIRELHKWLVEHSGASHARFGDKILQTFNMGIDADELELLSFEEEIRNNWLFILTHSKNGHRFARLGLNLDRDDMSHSGMVNALRHALNAVRILVLVLSKDLDSAAADRNLDMAAGALREAVTAIEPVPQRYGGSQLELGFPIPQNVFSTFQAATHGNARESNSKLILGPALFETINSRESASLSRGDYMWEVTLSDTDRFPDRLKHILKTVAQEMLKSLRERDPEAESDSCNLLRILGKNPEELTALGAD